jgi:hypothetical protein
MGVEPNPAEMARVTVPSPYLIAVTVHTEIV